MRTRQGSHARGDRPRRDHHDWASETYVAEWVKRQQAEDPSRAERFQLICDLFPFHSDATVTILDVGAGYGPVSMFILDRYPHATCIAQDGSDPMLNRARHLVAKYGERLKLYPSDLFEARWLPDHFGPFDAAVSSSCLHNLRDFRRIREIYGEIHTHLKPGGAFLNADLINAPTAALRRRYDGVAAARRLRDGTSAQDLAATVQHGRRSRATTTPGPFPATLNQHLAALQAVGFKDVDCFWKDLRRAVFGGFASKRKERRP
jgi:tRNA (cmo5U34)-methyltransferase